MCMLQIDKCFGFDTAVEEAQTALLAAKVEASSADQGIGLVKLMGRSSGFIAMQASMASGVLPPLFFSRPFFMLALAPKPFFATEDSAARSFHQQQATRGSHRIAHPDTASCILCVMACLLRV